MFGWAVCTPFSYSGQREISNQDYVAPGHGLIEPHSAGFPFCEFQGNVVFTSERPALFFVHFTYKYISLGLTTEPQESLKTDVGGKFVLDVGGKFVFDVGGKFVESVRLRACALLFCRCTDTLHPSW